MPPRPVRNSSTVSDSPASAATQTASDLIEVTDALSNARIPPISRKIATAPKTSQIMARGPGC